MIYPSMNKLMETMDSRYTLVIATAKRARLLADVINPDTDKPLHDKPVTAAVHELYEQKVTIIPAVIDDENPDFEYSQVDVEDDDTDA